MHWIGRSFLILVCLTGARPCHAEGMPEHEVTAAYLLNFVKFTEWPAKGQPIRLCVVGSASLRETLGALNGRKAGEHPLNVVGYTDADADLSHCDMVYLEDFVRQRFTAVLAALGDLPALTISNIEGFAQRGGCIGLFSRDNKMQFEVNLAAVRRAKLRLPAQVLNLAANVFGR